MPEALKKHGAWAALRDHVLALLERSSQTQEDDEYLIRGRTALVLVDGLNEYVILAVACESMSV